jgi:membrane-associated PAP2 superfamily phosphatase
MNLMKKQNLPVILLVILVLLLFMGYLMKENLNELISEKMRESAGTHVVLSGEQWVDSLFNYTDNGEDFEYTLLQFKSNGCTICR